MKKACDPAELRRARQGRKLSLRELGKLADCSYNTPFLLEHGGATNDALAARIARILDCPLDELFQPAVSSAEQDTVNREAAA